MNSPCGSCRIGVFYDGNFLLHASNYYNYIHPVKRRLSLGGLHSFIRHRVAEEEGIELFQNALDLIDGYADDESLLLEALHEAARNNHPVYDMLYLVLARRNAATLFTFDKKLRAICEANGVNCLGAASL